MLSALISSLMILFSSGPKHNNYLCFATDIQIQECGTYGWSNNKQEAKRAALHLCESHCGNPCTIDYCEKLK